MIYCGLHRRGEGRGSLAGFMVEQNNESQFMPGYQNFVFPNRKDAVSREHTLLPCSCAKKKKKKKVTSIGYKYKFFTSHTKFYNNSSQRIIY